MKRAIRMLFLTVGLLCTYTALAAPVAYVTNDGAPIPTCPTCGG